MIGVCWRDDRVGAEDEVVDPCQREFSEPRLI